MKKAVLKSGAALVLALAWALPAAAELPASQIARLGADLTPARRAARGQRFGHDTCLERRYHQAAEGLLAGRPPPRPVRGRPAALCH